MKPLIINSESSHLTALAHCHKNAFKHSLSSSMGIPYLRKMLEWYIVSPHTFIFHAEENGHCIAYCGGMITDGSQPTGSASGMLQYSFKSAVKSFLLRPWLLIHPDVRKKYPYIWRNILMKTGLKKPQRSQAEQQKLAQDPQVGLVVIGADPAWQGKGYGSILLKEFERRALSYNIPKLQLTVKADNDQAIRAYKRNGWLREKVSGDSLSMYKIL